jgi:hypothetical protein
LTPFLQEKKQNFPLEKNIFWDPKFKAKEDYNCADEDRSESIYYLPGLLRKRRELLWPHSTQNRTETVYFQTLPFI